MYFLQEHNSMTRYVLILTFSLVVCSIGSPNMKAGKFHIRCVKSKCGIPTKYNYELKSPEHAGSMTSAPAVSEITAIQDNQAKTILKRFIFPKQLQAGPVSLSGCESTLKADGDFDISGELTHSGGDTGSLRGGNVVITVKAMSVGSQSDSSPGVTYWTQKKSVWVKKGRGGDLDMTLTDKSNIWSTFPYITNMQVYLEIYPSR